MAHIEALVGVTLYFKTTTDAKNKLDARFAKAFKELNRQLDQHFNQYVAAVARKLRAWFNMFPPTSSPCAGCIAAATMTPRRGQGERMVSLRMMLMVMMGRRPWPCLAVNKHC